MNQAKAEPAFEERDARLLIDLLRTPTVSPLEAEDLPHIREAQLRFAADAESFGLRIIHHAPAADAMLQRAHVPEPVRLAAQKWGTRFLESQPNMVLRLGPERAGERTIMFNVHLDTVGGEVPVSFDGTRFTGRGAVDAKGPGVALLAGLRRAMQDDPEFTKDLTVLVQLVPGEEGGCMGVFGTASLVDLGHTGALNVFCEPTGHACAHRSSASMTARVDVAGSGAIDDDAGAGHNATVILAEIARTFARDLLPKIEAAGGRACIAGCHTGHMHNAVYGNGKLLLNLAYDTLSMGRGFEDVVDSVFNRALDTIESEYAQLPWLARTARECRDVTSLHWIKRRLPTLQPSAVTTSHPLRTLRLPTFPGVFTCDAIWMHDHWGHTIVYGPGDLGANNAHAQGEFVDLTDLERYARGVGDVVRAFRTSLVSS